MLNRCPLCNMDLKPVGKLALAETMAHHLWQRHGARLCPGCGGGAGDWAPIDLFQHLEGEGCPRFHELQMNAALAGPPSPPPPLPFFTASTCAVETIAEAPDGGLIEFAREAFKDPLNYVYYPTPRRNP